MLGTRGINPGHSIHYCGLLFVVLAVVLPFVTPMSIISEEKLQEELSASSESQNVLLGTDEEKRLIKKLDYILIPLFGLICEVLYVNCSLHNLTHKGRAAVCFNFVDRFV